MQSQYNGTAQASTSANGWVSQPNTRGTFDIAVSCAVTVFLCSWTVICPNVPVPGNSKNDLYWDKWHMFCLSMAGPEFIFVLAFGQLMSARAILPKLREFGCKDWTLKHAFYADMGGFVFKPKHWKAFPINAKQLVYLLERKYLTPPVLPLEELDDRDKSDGLARFIAALQMIWFTLNVIARPPQKLAVSAAELTTVAFVFCTLGTTYCWRKKPMDVSSSIVLKSDYTMNEILRKAGDVASEPYDQTPLEFVGREDWVGTLLWRYNVGILHRLHVVRVRPKSIPVQRISSFNFPKITRNLALAFTSFTMVYLAIFLAAWNFDFPTLAERRVWQTCTSITIGGIFIASVVELLSMKPSGGTSIATSLSNGDQANTIGLLPIFSRNSVPANEARTREPANFRSSPMSRLGVPTASMLLTEPIGIIYVFCRAIIVVEDITGLRALPATSFQNVEWTAYWPHL